MARLKMVGRGRGSDDKPRSGHRIVSYAQWVRLFPWVFVVLVVVSCVLFDGLLSTSSFGTGIQSAYRSAFVALVLPLCLTALKSDRRSR